MLTALHHGKYLAEKFGDGAITAIALHGWGRSRLDWSSTLGGTSAVAVDLPGFGAAPPPPEAWAPANYAAWLDDLVGDLDRPILLGHSFGGRVAVRYAAAHPDRVRGLILTGVPLVRPPVSARPKRGYRLGRALHQRGLISDERMEALRRKYGSADYASATGVMRETLVRTLADDYTNDLRAVGAAGLPALMVWGRADTAAPVAQAEEAAALIGDTAALRIVEESAHLIDPALTAALLEAWQEAQTW